jgi:hypothetical protein
MDDHLVTWDIYKALGEGHIIKIEDGTEVGTCVYDKVRVERMFYHEGFVKETLDYITWCSIYIFGFLLYV